MQDFWPVSCGDFAREDKTAINQVWIKRMQMQFIR